MRVAIQSRSPSSTITHRSFAAGWPVAGPPARMGGTPACSRTLRRARSHAAGFPGPRRGVPVARLSPAGRPRCGIAIILSACGGSSRPRSASPIAATPPAAPGAAPESQPPRPPTTRPASRSTAAASATRASTTWPRRASRTRRPPASRPPSAEAQGADGLRRQHPAPDRRGLPDDHHRRLQPGRRPRSTRRSPTRTSPSRRSTRPGTRRPTAPRPPTSPAWTSRSTRRRPSPATSRPASARPGILGTYGGQQFPGVTRFMDGLVAGINIYNEQNGTAVKLLGWDAAKQTGTFVGGDNPWGDPAKGEQLAKQFMDQGADIVHPVAGGTGNGSIKAMLAAGKWAIGVDTDQALSLPEYSKAILTSAEKADRRRGARHRSRRTPAATWAARTSSAPSPTMASRSPRTTTSTAQVSPELKAEVDQLARRTSPPARSRSPTTSSRRITAPEPLLSARSRPPRAGGLRLRGMEAVDAPRAEGHHQALPGRPRQRPDLDRRRPRRGPRPAGRERRRQEHPDEHPVGPLPARLGRDPHRRRRRAPSPTRGRRSMPASAWSTSTSSWSPSSTWSRPSRWAPRASRAARHVRPQDRAQAGRRAEPAVRPQRQPGREDRGPPRGRAPAGGDPQGALPQERHPRPGRAVRRPHAVRDGGAVRDHPRPGARPARPSSSSPTSSTRCWRSRTGSPCCAAGASRARWSRRTRPARSSRT